MNTTEFIALINIKSRSTDHTDCT